MKRLLILGILIISTAPLFAQAQQPNAAELAQKVVSIISADKAKTQTYCQVLASASATVSGPSFSNPKSFT